MRSVQQYRAGDSECLLYCSSSHPNIVFEEDFQKLVDINRGSSWMVSCHVPSKYAIAFIWKLACEWQMYNTPDMTVV